MERRRDGVRVRRSRQRVRPPARRATARAISPRSTASRNRRRTRRAPSFTLVDWRADGGALLVSTKDGYHLLDPRTDSMSLVYPFEADTATRPARTFQAWSQRRPLSLPRHVGQRTLGTRRRAIRPDGTARHGAGERRERLRRVHVSDDGSRFVFERSDGDRPNEVYTAGARLRRRARAHESQPAARRRGAVALGARELSRRRRQAAQWRALLSVRIRAREEVSAGRGSLRDVLRQRVQREYEFARGARMVRVPPERRPSDRLSRRSVGEGRDRRHQQPRAARTRGRDEARRRRSRATAATRPTC